MKTSSKLFIISNIVLLIVGYTYGLYLLLFDGKVYPFLVTFLEGFSLLLGLINFIEKQKVLSVLMFILVIFFLLLRIFYFFNLGHSSLIAP